MAITYYPTNTASDLGVGQSVTAPASARTLSQTAAGSASSLTITLAASGTNLLASWFAAASDPGVAGGSGAQNYSCKFNVTTLNANLTLVQLMASRVNSAGTLQTGGNFTVVGTELQSAGVKSFGPTSFDLGVFGATDRLRWSMTLTNTNTMTAQSAIIEIGLANGNEEVTAFASAAVASIPDIVMAPPR